MKRTPILVVGYGRFGRLAAAILSRRFEVHALDVRRTITFGRGIRRAGTAEIPRYSIVLLALPVHRLEGFLRSHGSRIAPGAFVADLSAVKEKPLRWMKSNLPSSVSFTGLHPLFGPDSTKKSHKGHTVVVCRGRTSDACHRRVLVTLKALGLKIIETNAITHDTTIASTLFITQWIGRVAIASGLGKPVLFESPSFSAIRLLMSRAASDRPDILRDIFRYIPHTRKIVKKVRARIEFPVNR